MRFSKVFYLLLALSATSAFVLPAKYSEGARPNVSVLFTPVAQPARALAAWATGRSGSAADQRLDQRPNDAVYQENQDLRQANVRLSQALAELRQIRAELDTLGDLKDLCTPVAVVGTDASTRDALALRSTTLGGLRDGQFAVIRHDVVGRLVGPGAAGAHVRLVTDPGSRVLARFGKFHKPGGGSGGDGSAGGFAPLGLTARLVRGAGRGRMVCQNIPHHEVVNAGLAVGDWAVIDDPDWRDLQGRRLGVVTGIRKGERLMAEIEIKPEADLLKLREVMVLTKAKK